MWSPEDDAALDALLERRELLKKQQASLVPQCRRCDDPMVVRFANKTGKPFWGCSNFPECCGYRRRLQDALWWLAIQEELDRVGSMISSMAGRRSNARWAMQPAGSSARDDEVKK